MTEHVFKLPDLGEGTVEAEIVAWHVSPGDVVAEGDVVADVMTDKANVEVPAPVSGTVLRTTGEPGDIVAVGTELIAFDVEGGPGGGPSPVVARDAAPSASAPGAELVEDARPPAPEPRTAAAPDPTPSDRAPPAAPDGTSTGVMHAATAPPEQAPGKVRTSPAIRRRASEAGVDLTRIAGTGPRGRILREDLDAFIAGQGAAPFAAPAPAPGGVEEAEPIEEVKIIGVRRVIAGRMQAAKREIPHFTFVDEVDLTALESLRAKLNATRRPGQPGLTYLTFIALAVTHAVREFPQCNAHHVAQEGVLRQFARVHLGVATQTSDGLKVPVVRDAGARPLWGLAAEIARVAAAARDGTATREELTGSTITLTSLGRLGGIASTPVINAPEVAIVGVNKAVKRPVVADDAIALRLMMNLSSSFDHRFVDGFDAASFIQLVKSQLEEPATLFIDQG